MAEELHFARAAKRLHIEQSPLSRAIKELEEDLGAQLFVRTTRSTRLTRARKLFQKHVPRVFTALKQARHSVKAAAHGFHSQLRVALSDDITPSRFSTFLALFRWVATRNLDLSQGQPDLQNIDPANVQRRCLKKCNHKTSKLDRGKTQPSRSKLTQWHHPTTNLGPASIPKLPNGGALE